MLTARTQVLTWIALGLAVSLSGCRAQARREESRIPQYGVIDTQQPRELDKVSLPPRVVEPPDELELTVRPTDPDLVTNRFVVQPEGIIDLGVFGDVYVAGLTIEQVEKKVTQHLARAYALKRKDKKAPTEVSIRVSEDKSKFYYVLGQGAASQNRFPITGHTTVLDAILQAGLRSNSLPEKAYLVRPHPSEAPDQVLRIDWAGITQRGDTLTNYQVLPGDRIYVPGTKPPGLLSTLLSGGL